MSPLTAIEPLPVASIRYAIDGSARKLGFTLQTVGAALVTLRGTSFIIN
jgi:hypothetical protein